MAEELVSSPPAIPPQEINYDAELDQVLRIYEAAIERETWYILNASFQFKSNNQLSLHCGLSPARCFEAAVKLINKLTDSSGNCHISFNSTEWLEFINMLNRVLKDDFVQDNGSSDGDVISPLLVFNCCEDIKLIRSTYQNVKMFIISKHSTYFYVTESDIREIINTDLVISKRIEMLNQINFNTYYQSFITGVNN